jgi:crotonobetainyl-CoA:carnitine CoA-transferase CaiB-like acyl-CoA transferase
MSNAKPLNGYRVVELSTFVAAPSCARLLGEWGADVIKVETPAGDAFRPFGATMLMPNSEDHSPSWEIANANKRAISIDLRNPAGKKVFHELLAKADVFVTNNRAEALKSMQLDYETLKEKYPRLVYALVTGYGEAGPDVNQPGFDTVAFWGRSGFLVDMVAPDSYPVYTPAGLGDLAVGLSLFGGICAALLNRQQTGKGDKVSVALYGAAIWLAGIMVTSAQESYGNKWPKSRLEGNPLAIPYRCKDGEWIIITIMEYARYWPAFCKLLDLPELIDDARFNTQAGVLANRAELIPIVEKAFAKKDSNEMDILLREADIVHDRLRHYKEITTDEQAWANNFVREHTFADGQKGILPCPPIQSTVMGASSPNRGPMLGEHTQEILAELGYSAGQIEAMKNNKIVKAR